MSIVLYTLVYSESKKDQREKESHLAQIYAKSSNGHLEQQYG